MSGAEARARRADAGPRADDGDVRDTAGPALSAVGGRTSSGRPAHVPPGARSPWEPRLRPAMALRGMAEAREPIRS